MRYVLDASVALKWVFPEPDFAKARQLRDEARAAVHELIAPDVFEPARAMAAAASFEYMKSRFARPLPQTEAASPDFAAR